MEVCWRLGPKQRALSGRSRSLLEMQRELSGQISQLGVQTLILKCQSCSESLSGELLALKEWDCIE